MALPLLRYVALTPEYDYKQFSTLDEARRWVDSHGAYSSIENLLGEHAPSHSRARTPTGVMLDVDNVLAPYEFRFAPVAAPERGAAVELLVITDVDHDQWDDGSSANLRLATFV